MNYTENNDHQDEIMMQEQEIIMNESEDKNTRGNDTTSKNDASHKGVNMDTGSMSQNNDAGRDEVSGKKTRTAYDGSYAHGVTADLDHVQTMTAFENAEGRLDRRREFLINKYEAIRTSYAETDHVGNRAKLLKRKSALETQIKTVDKTRKALESIKGDIEDAERTAQAEVEFINFSS